VLSASPGKIGFSSSNFKMAFIKTLLLSCVVKHNCHPSTREAEAGGLRIPGQSGLNSTTLSQKQTNEQNKNNKFLKRRIFGG
jgi:hypothetical protein